MSSRPNGPPSRDTDRILADFFAEEAPSHEPPILLPAVLARTALTRRRPVWRIPSWWLPASIAWRPRTSGRSNTMFPSVPVVTAGVLLALVGGVLLTDITPSPSSGGPGGAPMPSPVALEDTELEAGTTYYLDGAWGAGSPRLTFTVPAAGWSGRGGPNFGKDLVADLFGFHEILVTPWTVSNLLDDPCHWLEGELDPPVGPTVDDLAAALVQQSGGNASTPTGVTVGGYPGTKVELSLPADLDIATCDGGHFWRWMEYSSRGGHMYGSAQPDYEDGQRNIVYILDVDGLRVVIDAIYRPDTSEADLDEVDQLVGSMRFESAASSPSPSS